VLFEREWDRLIEPSPIAKGKFQNSFGGQVSGEGGNCYIGLAGLAEQPRKRRSKIGFSISSRLAEGADERKCAPRALRNCGVNFVASVFKREDSLSHFRSPTSCYVCA
jgi:hypothetical protein